MTMCHIKDISILGIENQTPVNIVHELITYLATSSNFNSVLHYYGSRQVNIFISVYVILFLRFNDVQFIMVTPMSHYH